MSYSSCTFSSNAFPILHAQRHSHPPHSFLSPPFAYHPHSHPHPHPHSPLQLLSSSQSHRLPSCSRLQEFPLASASESQNQQQQRGNYYENENPNQNQNRDEEEEEAEEVGISKIQVLRQKHISVSKSQLLDAILSTMFNQDKDAAHYFRLLTSCLDSILHAEHKSILEEMRSDYHLTNAPETANPETQVMANGKDSSFVNSNDVLPDHRFNLSSFLRSLDITGKNNNDRGSRVTISTRFQCSFMQLLSDAQFEELSARDLMLTSALNTDYLLTLPVYVDWKRAYESNAIIFRRGYATEKQNGLLIVEKLDYLQSKLLQTVFFVISKPLASFGIWISEFFAKLSHKHEVQSWTERLKLWLKEVSLFQKSLLYNDNALDGQIGVSQVPNAELPIWLAAQRAVARYEGILSPIGPRERLLRRLLSWIGLIPPTPETAFEVENDCSSPEPYLRPTFLSRISLSDTWRPATRKYCKNDPWKMLKTAISILFSQSVLQVVCFRNRSQHLKN